MSLSRRLVGTLALVALCTALDLRAYLAERPVVGRSLFLPSPGHPAAAGAFFVDGHAASLLEVVEVMDRPEVDAVDQQAVGRARALLRGIGDAEVDGGTKLGAGAFGYTVIARAKADVTLPGSNAVDIPSGTNILVKVVTFGFSAWTEARMSQMVTALIDANPADFPSKRIPRFYGALPRESVPPADDPEPQRRIMLAFELVANAGTMTKWRKTSRAYHLLILKHIDKIYTTIADTAKKLNDNNIHHLDLHTGNVLLTWSNTDQDDSVPTVHLIDFGISKTTKDLIGEGTYCARGAFIGINGVLPTTPLGRLLVKHQNVAELDNIPANYYDDMRKLFGAADGKYQFDTQGWINGILFWMYLRPVLKTSAYADRARFAHRQHVFAKVKRLLHMRFLERPNADVSPAAQRYNYQGAEPEAEGHYTYNNVEPDENAEDSRTGTGVSPIADSVEPRKLFRQFWTSALQPRFPFELAAGISGQWKTERTDRMSPVLVPNWDQFAAKMRTRMLASMKVVSDALASNTLYPKADVPCTDPASSWTLNVRGVIPTPTAARN